MTRREQKIRKAAKLLREALVTLDQIIEDDKKESYRDDTIFVIRAADSAEHNARQLLEIVND